MKTRILYESDNWRETESSSCDAEGHARSLQSDFCFNGETPGTLVKITDLNTSVAWEVLVLDNGDVNLVSSDGRTNSTVKRFRLPKTPPMDASIPPGMGRRKAS